MADGHAGSDPHRAGALPADALPADVAEGLQAFVAAAQAALGGELQAVVLFGSAAEGRLRATSDVNVIVVAHRFDPAALDALREPLRLARARLNLTAMLLRRDEVEAAAEAFAVKFADIRSRHRVLFGADPFAELQPSREAMRVRVRQELLNFILRTRERYCTLSLREEQLAGLVADAAGPLRSAAALLVTLQGGAAASPKQALEQLARQVGGERFDAALVQLSHAREHARLPPGAGAGVTLQLIDLAQAMRGLADDLA